MKANITEQLLPALKPRLLKKVHRTNRKILSWHIKNVSVLLNTVPQTQPLNNTSQTMGTCLALMKKIMAPYTLPKKKGRYMNKYENSYIYCESVKDNQINGKTTPRTNKIFYIRVHYETTEHSGHYIDYGSATGVHPWTTNAAPYHTTVAATFLQHNQCGTIPYLCSCHISPTQPMQQHIILP